MNHPETLKVHQAAAVSQNGLIHCSNVDLSLALRECGYDIPMVNTATAQVAPK